VLRIINKGLKDPILVLLGDINSEIVQKYDLVVLGIKSSEVILGETAVWLKFTTFKKMDEFIESAGLGWV